MCRKWWCQILVCNGKCDKVAHKGPKVTELLPKGTSQLRTPASVNLVLSLQMLSATEGSKGCSEGSGVISRGLCSQAQGWLLASALAVGVWRSCQVIQWNDCPCYSVAKEAVVSFFFFSFFFSRKRSERKGPGLSSLRNYLSLLFPFLLRILSKASSDPL